jgi:transcriptional regulator with XRE-family HTH domain
MENIMPHNGKMLEEFIRQSGISLTKVADGMDVALPTVSNYCKSQSLQMRILWKISHVLKRNLIAETGSLLSVPFVTANEIELQKKLEAVEKELEITKIELNVYKNIVRR